MKIRILPLLGLLFTLTMVGRAFALSSEALSPSANATANPAKDTGANHESPPDNTPAQGPTKAQCLTGDMLIEVNKKMAVFKLREAEMQAKESAFSAMQNRITKQLSAIDAAKASLDESVNSRVKVAQEDLAHLTLMYQSMKPKQAAKIFNEMDINFAAGFIREMKSSQAGLILSNMDANKAYQISLIIASRGAKYRTLGK